MPRIVVAPARRLARVHRQQRLGAVERLDLRFLVDAQDDGAVRRRHVEPDHIAHLGDEVGIGRQLEGLHPVWLQAEGPPDPLHRGRRQAARLGHAARAPMRGVGRQALEGSDDHRLDPLVTDRARRARARLVAQPFQSGAAKRCRHLRTVSGCTSSPSPTCRGLPSRRTPARSAPAAPAPERSAAAPPARSARPARSPS